MEQLKKELLAVVLAIKKFRVYLGKPFHLITNLKALQRLHSLNMANEKEGEAAGLNFCSSMRSILYTRQIQIAMSVCLSVCLSFIYFRTLNYYTSTANHYSKVQLHSNYKLLK